MKMKKLFLLILVASIIRITANASHSTRYWAKAYRDNIEQIPSWEYSASIINQTKDGGYIVAGNADSYDAGFYNINIWVLKLDSSGDIIWQETFGNIYYDRIGSIQQTSEGGYIIAGTLCRYHGNYCYIWLIKLDDEGKVSWEKSYGGEEKSYYLLGEYASSIQQTSEGGYIVAGSTDSFGVDSRDIWILKLDGEGNVSWQKTYGGNSNDDVRSIQQTSDGGYIVAGDTYSFGSGFSDIWTLKLDSVGNVFWQKTYGGSYHDSIRYIYQNSDGDYIMAGSINPFGPAYLGNTWLIKIDNSGNIIWEKTYGEGYFAFIQQALDNGYAIAGVTYSLDSAWILKIDNSGEIPDCDIIQSGNAYNISDTSVVGVNTTIEGKSSNAIVSDIQNLLFSSFAEVITVCEGDFYSTTTTTTPKTTTITSTTSSSSSTTTSIKICPVEKVYKEDSEEAELLRYFRDYVLSQTPEGQELIRLYYEWSHRIVKTMEEDEEFKEQVKEIIDRILPLIGEEVTK